MADYGEPWRWALAELATICEQQEGGKLIAREVTGHDVNHKRLERALACVNALAGCPDPQAFVKAIKKAGGARNSATYAEELAGEYEDLFNDPALAWLRKGGKDV